MGASCGFSRQQHRCTNPDQKSGAADYFHGALQNFTARRDVRKYRVASDRPASSGNDAKPISVSGVSGGLFMRATSSVAVLRATETARTPVRDTEQSFGSIFANIARMLWPEKTAANVAAAIGCSERAAEFYLAGDRDWSGDAIAAIVAEVLKRHSMRNARVVARK